MYDEQIFTFYKILLTNDFPNSIGCLESKQVPILSTLNLLNAKILLLKEHLQQLYEKGLLQKNLCYCQGQICPSIREIITCVSSLVKFLRVLLLTFFEGHNISYKDILFHGGSNCWAYMQRFALSWTAWLCAVRLVQSPSFLDNILDLNPIWVENNLTVLIIYALLILNYKFQDRVWKQLKYGMWRPAHMAQSRHVSSPFRLVNISNRERLKADLPTNVRRDVKAGCWYNVAPYAWNQPIESFAIRMEGAVSCTVVVTASTHLKMGSPKWQYSILLCKIRRKAL